MQYRYLHDHSGFVANIPNTYNNLEKTSSVILLNLLALIWKAV